MVASKGKIMFNYCNKNIVDLLLKTSLSYSHTNQVVRKRLNPVCGLDTILWHSRAKARAKNAWKPNLPGVRGKEGR